MASPLSDYRAVRVYIKHLDKQFVVAARPDWKVGELKVELAAVYAAVCHRSEAAAPLTFDLLHRDHILYDDYAVGEVLRDGDHINTISRPIPTPSSSTGLRLLPNRAMLDPSVWLNNLYGPPYTSVMHNGPRGHPWTPPWSSDEQAQLLPNTSLSSGAAITVSSSESPLLSPLITSSLSTTVTCTSQALMSASTSPSTSSTTSPSSIHPPPPTSGVSLPAVTTTAPGKRKRKAKTVETSTDITATTATAKKKPKATKKSTAASKEKKKQTLSPEIISSSDESESPLPKARSTGNSKTTVTISNSSEATNKKKKNPSKKGAVSETLSTQESASGPDSVSHARNPLTLATASKLLSSPQKPAATHKKPYKSALIHSTTQSAENMSSSPAYSSSSSDEDEVKDKKSTDAQKKKDKQVEPKDKEVTKTKQSVNEQEKESSLELFSSQKPKETDGGGSGDSDSSDSSDYTTSSDDEEDVPQPNKSSSNLKALASDATSNTKQAQHKSSALVPPNAKVHDRLQTSTFSLTDPTTSAKFKRRKIQPVLALNKKRSTSTPKTKRTAAVMSTDDDGDQDKNNTTLKKILDNEEIWQ